MNFNDYLGEGAERNIAKALTQTNTLKELFYFKLFSQPIKKFTPTIIPDTPNDVNVSFICLSFV